MCICVYLNVYMYICTHIYIAPFSQSKLQFSSMDNDMTLDSLGEEKACTNSSNSSTISVIHSHANNNNVKNSNNHQMEKTSSDYSSDRKIIILDKIDDVVASINHDPTKVNDQFSSPSSSSYESSSWSQDGGCDSSCTSVNEDDNNDSRNEGFCHHQNQLQQQQHQTSNDSINNSIENIDDRNILHVASSNHQSNSQSSLPASIFSDHIETEREHNANDKEYESCIPNITTTETTTPTKLVPTDQERQLLILVLLAQVCALHDPTPRTFTIHVLELYEHGILDRISIQFLYDLGLVPSPLLIADTSMTENSNVTENKQRIQQQPKSSNEEHNSNLGNSQNLHDDSQHHLALLGDTNNIQHQQHHQDRKNFLRQRSLEASAIRSSLELQEKKARDHSNHGNVSSQGNNSDQKQKQQNQYQPQRFDEMHQESESEIPRWSVKEYPLSLSRYQREFEQICLLSSGSFGSVFKSKNRMDERHYAIKRILFSAEGYSRASVQMMIREVHCLAICDHPNVVRYYTSWLEPSWMTGATSSSTHNASPGTSSNSFSGDMTSESQIDPHRFGFLHRNDLKKLEDNLKYYVADQSEGTIDEFHALLQGNPLFHQNEDHLDPSVTITNEKRHVRVEEDISLSSQFEWKTSLNYVSWQPKHQYHYDDSSRDDIYFEDSVTTTIKSQNEGIIDSNMLDDNNNKTIAKTDDSLQNDTLAIRPQHRQGANNYVEKQQKRSSPRSKGYKYEICLFIQMQLCHPATLADWIRERNTNLQVTFRIQDHQVVDAAAQIFRQVINGLHHVHQKGIIHRDLKPANIFVSTDDGELQFKIGDFGLSKLIQCHHDGNSMMSSLSPRATQQDNAKRLLLEYVSQKPVDCDSDQESIPTKNHCQNTNVSSSIPWNDPLTAGVGTASYAAPEQVDSTSYTSAVDIFSVGLVLLELLCSFSTEHERLQTFYDCRHRRIIPDIINQYYPIAAQTILACTEYQPDKRPLASELKRIDISVRSQDVNGIVVSSLFESDSKSCSKMMINHDNGSSNDQNLSETENVENTDDECEELRRKLLQYEMQCTKHKKEMEEKDAMIDKLLQELNQMKKTIAPSSSN